MRLLGAGLALLLTAGCMQGAGNGTDTASVPYDHSSLVNRSDQFVLTGDVQRFDSDHTYTWHTTATQYTTTWGGHVTSGSFDVQVKDALGQAVYAHTFAANSDTSGSETVQGKLMGDWTIQVTFKGCTCSLYFVIQ